MMLKLGVVLLLAYTCAGQSTGPEKCSDYTLPDTFTPWIYYLKLFLHDPKADTYEGKVTIHVFTTSFVGEYKNIVLNAKGLDFSKEDVTVEDVRGENGVDVESVVFNGICEKVTITLATPLKQNDYRVIAIKFKAKLRTDMYGLYKSTYMTTTSTGATEETTIIASQFHPTHARSAFPCFDEPAMKAAFHLQVDVPEEYGAVLSNQRIKENGCQTPFAGRGLKRICFEQTPSMSAYMLALVVSKFDSTVVVGGKIKMGLYAQPDLIDQLAHAKSVSNVILSTLWGITGIDYIDGGINKLDQVAIPDFSVGAMENWGLVTYRESALLSDKDHSTTRNKQRTSQIIAHEFSHMWFGNMLTPKTWDYAWLNEGFARYFEYFGIKDLKAAEEQFVVEQVQSALAADDVADASCLNEEAKSPEEIKAKFNTISYNKGASILRMLEKYLGKDKDNKGVFLEKLKTYFSENINYRERTTTPSQLWRAFHVKDDDQTEGNMVEDIFPAWADQPGYPLVTVSLGDDNKLTFKQEPFTYTGELSADNQKWKWTIPITYWLYTTKFEAGQMIFDRFKSTAEATAKENMEFVVVNPGQTGYYRVKYDGGLLDKLSEALQNETIRDKMDEITRAQIVDDAFNLARAGHTTYGEAMAIVSYLADEVSYYPWHAAFRGFSYLRRRVTDETLGNYIVRQMTELSEAVYNETLKPNKNPSDIEIYRKVLVHQWMCELNVEDCVDNAKELLDKQFATTNEDVPVDLRSFVYCSALRHSDDLKNWGKLWNRYQESNIANEKVTILTALGCTTDEDKLKDYLEKSLTDVIGSQDATTVFSAVLTGNPVGVSVAVEFLKYNYGAIRTKYGGLNAINDLVLSVADRIVKEEDRDAFLAMLNNDDFVEEMGLTKKIVQAAKDTLDTNERWIAKNQESLSAYYKGLYGGGGAASMTAAAGLLVLVVLNFFL